MESLNLGDHYLRRNDAIRSRTYQQGYRPPRLPTPEPSRSSFEAGESKNPLESAQHDPVNNAAWKAPRDNQPPQVYGFRASPSSRPASRRQAAPQSPPYEMSDEKRPSLPPLKTVLGENLSSPPCTPRIRSANVQPAPREPTYTTDTYKPPSLYPNKKQKRETLEPVPPFGSVSFVSPPLTVFASPVRTTMPSNLSFTTSNSQYKPGLPRRQSGHESETRYRSRSPPRSVQGMTSYRDARPTNGSLSHQTQHYGVSECSPLPATLDRLIVCEEHDRRPGSSDLPRFPSSGFNEYYPLSTEERHSRSAPQPSAGRYQSPTTEELRRREAVGYLQRVEHEPFSPGAENARGTVQNTRHSDGFAPGSYEYYYTKARKRSNLPKHSTEIMRAWFDQNMANPYPSEDQKALFANATGISLTQVSNWFINHRRRCPELRDKRVERRKP